MVLPPTSHAHTPSLPHTLQQRFMDQLQDVDQRGLRRRLRLRHGVDFSSNDYLGLASHPALHTRVQARLAAWQDKHAPMHGYGATASRLLGGHHGVHADVECRFAAFKGMQAALLFANGYMANLALLTTLVQPNDRVISDAHNHASMIDGVRLSRCHKIIFPHGDTAALERALQTPHTHGHTFVLTESLFSMDGDCAPLATIAALCRAYDAALIVDDSHATGVFGGDRGSGDVEQAGIADHTTAVVSTCGKALGVFGAFVTAPQLVIDAMINLARPFIFTTAPSPHMAMAIDSALDVLAENPTLRQRVLQQAHRLRARLHEHGLSTLASCGPIVPVVIGDNDRAMQGAEQLQSMGFDVRAVRPPTVAPGTARWRICVHANHDDATIDALADATIKVVHPWR